MLIGRYSCVLDACVLHPAILMGSLLWLASERLYRPYWSDTGRLCQRAAENLLEAPCFSFELVGWSVGVVAHPARAVHLPHGSVGCFAAT
jgi:hypothetical protein